MKLVKFNCNISLPMYNDLEFEELKIKMKQLKLNDYKSYIDRMNAGHDCEWQDFKIGEEGIIHNWQFEAFKNDSVDIGISFDKYKDATGNPIPFDTQEALRHGDIKQANETMKKVNKFTLIKDLDENISITSDENFIKRGRPPVNK